MGGLFMQFLESYGCSAFVIAEITQLIDRSHQHIVTWADILFQFLPNSMRRLLCVDRPLRRQPLGLLIAS